MRILFQSISTPLARRMGLYVILASTMITIFTSSIQLYREYQRDVSEINSSLDQIEKTQLTNIATRVWVLDIEELEVTLNNLIGLSSIEYIAVYDHGDLLLTVGEDFERNTIIRELPLIYKHNNQNNQIGLLVIKASLYEAYQLIFDRAIVIIVSNAIKTFIVAGLILLIFYFLIGRHLSRIAQYAEKLDINMLDKSFEFDRKKNATGHEDELDILRNSIIKMQQNLGKATNSLKANEERLRYALDATSDGVWDWNIKTGEIIFSDKWCQSLGYEANEVDGNLSFWEGLLHPDDKDETWKLINDHFERRTETYVHENRLRKKSGEYRYNLDRGRVIEWDEDGKPLRMIGTDTDITERKRAEQELAKSEERFSKVVNFTEDAVIISRIHDNKILFVNPGYTKLNGYTEQECVGSIIGDLNYWVNPKERTAFFKLIEKDERVKGFEAISRRKNGESFPVSLSAFKINIDEEDCMVTWVHDLSDKKRTEHEKYQLEQQLFRSQKMDAVGQLTGGIAHDFNNILQSILGYTRLALRLNVEDSTGKLANYLTTIQHGGERAREMISQMLAFSRSMPSKFRIQPLQPLVESSLKLLRPSLPSSLDILWQLPGELPDIKVDPTQFEQIVMNLCINARDSMQGNGSIEIALFKISIQGQECHSCHEIVSGSFVTLLVKDSGSGISAEVKARIFEPFYTTKEIGKGSGMGLPMIHGIMHQHGGHIQVTSTIGDGTTFKLLFPISEDVLQSVDESLKKSTHVKQKSKQKGGRIMIVDDELTIANYLSELLISQGFEVVVPTNSENALITFKNSFDKIDLVITDQTMPGLTGLELAQELLLLRSNIPIILITGYSEQVDESTIKRAGIKSYLNKPIEEVVLLDRINELLMIRK